MLKDVSIDDYLFTDEDYDTFQEQYQKSIHPDIMRRRKQVQEKLDIIHQDLLPELWKRGYNVDIHPAATKWKRLKYSWDRPVPYNKGIVNWMGIRYGRKTEVEALNWGAEEKEQKIGFQKFTCFQVDVAQYGVEVGMFHAVPYDNIDRPEMRSKMSNAKFRQGLIDILKDLKGYGLVWSVSPKGLGTPEDVEQTFAFDFEDVENFPEWYMKYDTDGSYSSLLYRFPKWDRRVLKENIVNSCLDIFDILYPIYDYIKWKGKGI